MLLETAVAQYTQWLHDARRVEIRGPVATLCRLVLTGPLRVGLWRRHHIQAYLDGRCKEVHPNTVRGEFHSDISPFFRWCKRRNLIHALPLEDIELPAPVPTENNRVVTREEIDKVLPWLDRIDRAAIWVMWTMGLRPSECRRIHAEDLDLDTLHLHVRLPTKGKKPRKVPIADHSVAEALGILAATQVSGEKVKPPQPLLKRLDAAMRRLTRLHDTVAPFTLKDLRASRLTLWAEEGWSPITIQAWAGHASLKTTMRYFRAYRAETQHPQATGQDPWIFQVPAKELPKMRGRARCRTGDELAAEAERRRAKVAARERAELDYRRRLRAPKGEGG